MKKLALLTLTASALVIGGVSQIRFAKTSNEAKDATIIVKMNTNVDNFSEQQLVGIQNSLLNEISTSITSNYRLTSRYTKIFNGFVLDVPSKYVDSIRNLNRVDKVNYNIYLAQGSSNNDGVKYEIPLSTGTSTASSDTLEKPDNTNDGKGTFIAILDSAFYIQTAEDGTQTFHEVFSPLKDEDAVITQASLKAKIDAEEKFHGKYDATHSTYYNNKVPFYYDYGGDTSGTTMPDFDVYAEGQDHGTHVASIAGGNAGEKYEGIAPRAQMALMKVFRTYMQGQTYQSGAPADAVLNALEDCITLGVDTVNMSLGSNLNDFEDAEIAQETIRKLNEKGTFVCVAAGNEGKGQYSSTVYRYWTTDMVETNIISSYANNMGAMTVASSQADSQFYGEALTIDGTNVQFSDQVTNYNTVEGPVTYNPERYLKDLTKDGQNEFEFVYLPGLGKIEEYEGIDVNGKIAVVNRGDITFKEKVDNAVSKGAIAVLIIDNTTETEFTIRMSFSEDNSYNPLVPVAFILNKDKEVFSESISHKAKFLIDVDLDNPNKRTISDYSSDGMKYDLSIKPEITTPGENIKGAVLGATDKYESMSGTSMATPNFCGTTALMIGEHLGDANYRSTINARLMSTAQPMKDNTSTANFTSVRRQGAGLVNITSALTSPVYLDGIDAEGNRLGKAKVELFNNDDIKVGNVKLAFDAINESAENITYTATTYVLAPGVEEFNAESYPEYAGQKFQSIRDQLVETFVDTVNVPANAVTKIELAHQVASDKLTALDADYENGCILEGYTILTAENKPQLSIPFLGFYGDLDAMSPVEPFDFEHEDGKTYDSDFLNKILNENIGNNGTVDMTRANYTSRIVSGYWKDTTNSLKLDDIAYNTSNLSIKTDENGNKLGSVGINPFDNSATDRLYVGNTKLSNTLIIQQYVRRSVKDNTITVKDKATNQVVLTEHMADLIMGSAYDEATKTRTYPLYKSHLDLTGLYDSGFMAHRAYGVIPLYTTDASGKQNSLPDGEYELTFTYKMMAGGEYTMSYTLVINSEFPVLKSIEKVDGAYRFHYTDTSLSYIDVNGEKYAAHVDENNGVYVDVPEAKFASSTTATVESVNLEYVKEKFITHVDDEDGVMVANAFVGTGFTDFTYTKTKTSDISYTYSFSFTNGKKEGKTSGDITFRIRLPEGFDASKLVVYSVANNGKEKELKFTINDGVVEFASSIKNVKLSNGKEETEPTPTPTPTPVTPTPTPKKGCGGSIIASSTIISIVSALGVSLLFIKKKHD